MICGGIRMNLGVGLLLHEQRTQGEQTRFIYGRRSYHTVFEFAVYNKPQRNRN